MYDVNNLGKRFKIFEPPTAIVPDYVKNFLLPRRRSTSRLPV